MVASIMRTLDVCIDRSELHQQSRGLARRLVHVFFGRLRLSLGSEHSCTKLVPNTSGYDEIILFCSLLKPQFWTGLEREFSTDNIELLNPGTVRVVSYQWRLTHLCGRATMR